MRGIGLNKLLSSVSGATKDQLVYAEMQYRQGHAFLARTIHSGPRESEWFWPRKRLLDKVNSGNG
jgi:hypothetical protein